MTTPLDPNRFAYRPDLAAAALRGRVRDDRFVTGQDQVAVRGLVPVRAAPEPTAMMTTELLFGEGFTVYERRPDGWAWGQCGHDGYVGYAWAEALGPVPAAPVSHRVAVPRAFLYAKPGFKRSPVRALSMAAQVAVTGMEGGYARIAAMAGLPEGGFVYGRCLAPAGQAIGRPLEIARRFLDVPYLWGGRSSLGLDCSGLIQIACQMAAYACPRDTYMQADELGQDLPAEAPPEPGDIVFFPGHVGFQVDDRHLLHANATHMAVTIDPVDTVAAWTLRAEGAGVTRRRRLPPPTPP